MIERLRRVLDYLFRRLRSLIDKGERIPFHELKKRGEVLLDHLREFNPMLGYDDASIQWLDGYIQRNRHVFSDEGRYGVALGFGYVLGETIIRAVGGRWEYNDDQKEWLVQIGPPVGAANPIGKAYKHLSDDFESIASMLRITRMVAEKGGWDKIGTPLGSGDNHEHDA